MNPFVEDSKKAIGSLGESELIQRMRDWLGASTLPEPAGIGDDCAVFSPSSPDVELLITTDPVIYGKHFDDAISPEQVASKLANRSVSDIAAMGGRPTIATVSLAISSRVSTEWIERFYKALAANAVKNEYSVVGGDVSSADDFLGAFLTLVGETLPETAPLVRRASPVGCHIYVTGDLGGSRLNKHFAFTPRVAEGQWLAHSGACCSCTDLSDGLGKDLANILPAKAGCEIDCLAIPISEDAQVAAKLSGKSRLYHVFNDGEDYELLFTVNPTTDLQTFETDWKKRFPTRLTRIGRVTERSSSMSRIRLLNTDESLVTTGYEHFR